MPGAHDYAGGFLRYRRAIDWVYLAGPVETISSAVCEDVAVSDHYPIWFELKLTG
jgi:endonuclease/exonuclease/phosphatase family metal-dependent hydrolase